MKRLAIMAFAFSIFAVSCKKEEKVETPIEETVETGLKIVSDSTKVNWVAYKTTDKVAVKGSFTQIELKNTHEGTTPEAILEGATFSIPVSSLFTNDDERDSKLRQFFFGALNDTEIIGGVINFVEGKTILMISLNGVVKPIEVTSTFENNRFSLNGNINLEDFGAQQAIESINNVCADLHKGADGVSKTWSEVAISGSVLFE
jgi:polyisoprenoid-binding protein YceI